MSFTEARIRGILLDLIDEDPMACRAVLGICAVEFTTGVPTAAVSLGERSVLRINPEFVRKHCQSEDDVRLLLLHEFMHVALAHTRRFRTMTTLLNVAMDAVINSVLWRRLGAQRCGLLLRTYRGSQGIGRLLAPPAGRYKPGFKMQPVEAGMPLLDGKGRPTPRFHKIHEELYSPGSRYSLDDMLALLRDELGDTDGLLLLGHHGPEGYGTDLPDEVLDRLDRAVAGLAGRLPGAGGGPFELDLRADRRWVAQVQPLLRRLLTRQHAGAPPEMREVHAELPVLSTSDRRTALRSLWSPILPFSQHRQVVPGPQQGLVVYLDVSGSIKGELPLLLGLMANYAQWLADPLYAFSTEVKPARFRNGRLVAPTTGGTLLDCVCEHARRMKVQRALVITDGYVEPGLPPPCPMEALIPHNGVAHALEGRDVRVTRLPER